MKKDAYYFPHFSNARNDSKLIKLRRVMGIEGYGMYFLLLEVLREQTEFKLPMSILEDLAFEWHTSKEKLLAVVCNFDLFEIDDNMFISSKLVLYLQPYIEKSERARLAANKRWNKIKGINANADANALHEQSVSNASKVKESKVKESKVKESKKIKQSILNSSIWIESFCLNKKIKKVAGINFLVEFLDDLELKDDLSKGENEIKRHFINWLNIELKKEKSSAKKEKGHRHKVEKDLVDFKFE